MAMINSVLISDREIANYLNRTLGLPVQVGEFAVANQTLAGNLRTESWKWNSPGEDPSSLTLANIDSTGIDHERSDRYFWQNGKGISYLDLQQVQKVPNPETYASYGTMSQPMLFATYGTNAFAAPSNFIIDSSITASIVRFGDLLCEHKL